MLHLLCSDILKLSPDHVSIACYSHSEVASESAGAFVAAICIFWNLQAWSRCPVDCMWHTEVACCCYFSSVTNPAASGDEAGRWCAGSMLRSKPACTVRRIATDPWLRASVPDPFSKTSALFHRGYDRSWDQSQGWQSWEAALVALEGGTCGQQL